jgi:hypothetical protein
MVAHAFGIVLVLAGLALAQEASLLLRYHPMPSAARLAVAPCARGQNRDGRNVLSCRSGRIVWQGALDFMVEDPNRSVTLEVNPQSLPIRLDPLPMFLDSAFEGDWNADRRPDFAVKLAWGGNGIIGDMAVIVFALSSGDRGYTLRAINSLTFDRHALVVRNGKPTVLHVALVSANGSDGRNHNYFVYTPLEIRGDALLATAARTWIQYTYTENHRPARNISEREKERTWLAEKPEVFVLLR